MSERGPGAQPAGDHVLRPCCRLIPGCRMSRQTGRHSHLRRAYRPARRFPDGQGIQPAPCAVSSHLFLPLSNFAYTKFYTRPHHKIRVTPNLKQVSVRACLKSPPRMSWRRIFRPDCVKNPCHPSGCLRIFALQGKKSTRQSIHVEILNRLLENSPNRSISICASSGSVRSVWSFFRWPRRSSSPAIRLASVFPCLTPPDQVYLFLHLQFLFMRHSFAPPISDSFLFLCLLLREHIINHQVVAAYSSYTQFHGACLLHVGFFRKDTPLFCRYDKPDSAFWDFIYFTLVVAALV